MAMASSWCLSRPFNKAPTPPRTASSSPCATISQVHAFFSSPPSLLLQQRRRRLQVVRMAPQEQRLTRRSPGEFPVEWVKPKPGRRADIFPKFGPMKTLLPPPMPTDPPLEEEDFEEEAKPEGEPNTRK